MIAEAVDAAIAVGWALLVWIALLAVFATAALYTLVAAVVCAVLAVRRGVVAVMSLVRHSSGGEAVGAAPGAADACTHPAPAWARTQPITKEN